MSDPKPAPRPIGRWTVEVTCPCCGGILAHVADGRPSGSESRALAKCTGCDRQWMAEITLTEATTRVVGPGMHGGRPSHPPGCDCAPCLGRSAA